ncbi:hypothetical protein VUR80DRAFT_5745 [Thermomyces stellatus]
MYQEYLGPDGCGFVQVLAHLVEDLDTWQQLGLRLGPTAQLYTHDESSASFNYRIEHTNLELPTPVSTGPVNPQLESIRCHLNFNFQASGFSDHVQGRGPRKPAAKNVKKRKQEHSGHSSLHGERRCQGAVIHSEFTPTTLATVASDKTPGTGIRMVSDHLEVDTVSFRPHPYSDGCSANVK